MLARRPQSLNDIAAGLNRSLVVVFGGVVFLVVERFLGIR